MVFFFICFGVNKILLYVSFMFSLSWHESAHNAYIVSQLSWIFVCQVKRSPADKRTIRLRINCRFFSFWVYTHICKYIPNLATCESSSGSKSIFFWEFECFSHLSNSNLFELASSITLIENTKKYCDIFKSYESHLHLHVFRESSRDSERHFILI